MGMPMMGQTMTLRDPDNGYGSIEGRLIGYKLWGIPGDGVRYFSLWRWAWGDDQDGFTASYNGIESYQHHELIDYRDAERQWDGDGPDSAENAGESEGWVLEREVTA